MNEEMNERLQQAVGQYIKKYKDFRFRNAGKKAFCDGADWHQNNVWRDVSELPRDNSRIVVVGQSNDVFSCEHTTGGKYRAYWSLYDLRKCKKWCYIEDLLPVNPTDTAIL